MKKGLLVLGFIVFLTSCGKSPTACECKDNLDLVVNHEQNAATTYVGEFKKDVYETCIGQYKKENDLEGEVLIKVVFEFYEEACVN